MNLTCNEPFSRDPASNGEPHHAPDPCPCPCSTPEPNDGYGITHQ